MHLTNGLIGSIIDNELYATISTVYTVIPWEGKAMKGNAEFTAATFNDFRYLGFSNWVIDHGRYASSSMTLQPKSRPDLALESEWAEQLADRLLFPVPDATALPGGRRFLRYLRKLVGNGLVTIDPPIFLGWNKALTVYVINVDGKKIGEYRLFARRPWTLGRTREYHGTIPGYNDGKKVTLIWDNFYCEPGDFFRGKFPRLVRTFWRRQDYHAEVEFA